jgi:hypothetical protein
MMPYCVPGLTRDGYDLLLRCEKEWGVNGCSWYVKADETKDCVHAKKYESFTKCGCTAVIERAMQEYFDAD